MMVPQCFGRAQDTVGPGSNCAAWMQANIFAVRACLRRNMGLYDGDFAAPALDLYTVTLGGGGASILGNVV